MRIVTSMESENSVIEVAQQEYSIIAVIVNVFTLRIVWASEKFATKLGYTQEEMVDMPAVEVTDLKPTDALKEAVRLFTTHEKESKPVITKSGEELRIQTEVHPLLHDKEPYIIVTNLEFV